LSYIGKTVEEAVKNIEEVKEVCSEEEKPNVLNKFFRFREIEMSVAV